MKGFDLDGFLPYRLAVLSRRVSAEFGRVYGARFGITIPEWRVLAHLSQHDRVSVREVAAQADMDKVRVSRAVARLEAAGYVRKRGAATDRRLVELSLTPRGEALMEEIAPLARAYEEEVFRALSPEEARAFSDAISVLLDRSAAPEADAVEDESDAPRPALRAR